MRHNLSPLLVAALLAPGLSLAEPVPEKVEKAYSNAYTKERFQNADKDKDGKVSRKEAGAAATSVEHKAAGKARFNMADRDGDGKLTLEEARAQKQLETRVHEFAENHPKLFRKMVRHALRHRAQGKKLARLARDNPEETRELVRWIVKHPHKAKKLARLAKKHPRLARKIIKHRLSGH
jgi:hypothetical protein